MPYVPDRADINVQSKPEWTNPGFLLPSILGHKLHIYEDILQVSALLHS